MTARLLLTVLFLLLFAVFVTVNWSAFIAPTTLSLVVDTVQAPLGLVLLGVLTALAAIFLVYMAWWQGRVLMETRRHTQELQAQRVLADQAEASRFTALQTSMTAELGRLEARLDVTQSEVMAHVDAGIAELRQAVQDSSNTLAAYIGEVEDRFERGADPARTPRLT
ncbi:MAG: LapA family protein [Methylibium sp.]|uniref:LapA family protein n=1 Tax=Methylibium sp. TaxID=2067992 RepID=UPI0017D8504D|nr:LapA family protein [Methylibium sp.]MBA3598971.1 LapA family protein [Methylibium sp.]